MPKSSTIERKSPERETAPVIAVVGNPNTGKTTLFNSLCGTRQKTGNYPGVTVSRKSGWMTMDGREVRVDDLPGSYSLKADSYDEQVVIDALMGRVDDGQVPDLILYVLDATNLKRNLYLLSQILELDIPVVLALTMSDQLDRNEITLDFDELQRRLGAPLAVAPAGDKSALSRLILTIKDALDNPPNVGIDLDFPAVLEDIVGQLQESINVRTPISRFEARNLLMFRKDPLNQIFNGDEESHNILERYRGRADEKKIRVPAMVAARRYAWADAVVNAVETRVVGAKKSLSEKIDGFLTHRGLGLLAYVGIMCTMFSSIYFWAAPVMDLIDGSFGFLGDLAKGALVGWPILSSLVADGVIGGVGSVIIFLPQIVILFAFIALLEDSGYLARASFLMDKLLSWSGLNGRAFIPMLSGFACAVPAVMSARVMSDPRARLTTVLITPLISCSARLPVYILLIGAFIEPRYGSLIAGLAFFFMHALGLLVALPLAWILNRGFLKTPTIPFVMELPPYRLPRLKNIFFRVWEAGKKFTVRAGTVIFAFTVIIWALTYFPRSAESVAPIESEFSVLIESAKSSGADAKAIKALESRRDNAVDSAFLEDSFLGRSGKFIQPVFAPLGFDWKITVGVLAAFPAREVIIAALGIIYSVGDADETSGDLKNKMINEKHPDGSTVFTPLVAVTVMIFFALCCQCMSTVITVQKELNSWGWASFMFFYMTGMAYVVSLAVYQFGTALGG